MVDDYQRALLMQAREMIATGEEDLMCVALCAVLHSDGVRAEPFSSALLFEIFPQFAATAPRYFGNKGIWFPANEHGRVKRLALLDELLRA